jgi:hypothetical protein
MTLISRCLLTLAVASAFGCGESLPPVDTPKTLPPAEPPADVTRGKATEGASEPAPEKESKPLP